MLFRKYRIGIFTIGFVTWLFAAPAFAQSRPNILWIVIEDMSPHFSCYGETTISTPHIDRLAAAGVRFTNAFTTGPVCSASRSALITGMYQTSIGAHHHRSGRGTERIRLPESVVPIPVLFRSAGYYTANGDDAPPRPDRPIAKTDYNFDWDAPLYDGPYWTGRAAEQPFFAQIQLDGGKLRERALWEQRAERALDTLTDPKNVQLPPYLPNDSVLQEDWARYQDTVRYTDLQVERILGQLELAGLADSTYVFLFTDHGISHVRAKQFCYDAGIHIPLIIRGPGIVPGSVNTDLTEHIDIAAMSLALAGIPIPVWMQGKDILSSEVPPRQYVHSARDRCDETVDRIRSVRTTRYKYIRNFYPDRPYLQPNAYKDHKPIMRRMRELHAAQQLNQYQSLILAPTRPKEELYDLENDPHELHNLVGKQEHERALIELRGELAGWIVRTGDQAQRSESAAMYAADMQVYLNDIRKADPARAAHIERNIEQMRIWEAERK